jgi:folate-binding protein YgfZ
MLSDYDRLRRDAGLFELKGWSLLRIWGEDRNEWLQGQVTNDLRQFTEGGASSFCFCSATGQIQVVADAWADSNSYYLTCETVNSSAVLRRVEELVIMEDVEIKDLTTAYRGFSIQGPKASLIDGEGILAFPSRRTVWGGWDLWLPEGAALPHTVAELSIGDEAVEIARLEAGIPRAGVDYDAKTLVPELGSDFAARHISYTKGCYTGQEVLMRIYSRGHTNKTWMGLVCEARVVAGALVEGSGRVTSAVISPELGPIAAVFLRNEVALEGQEVQVQMECGMVRARVKTMPFLAGPT